MSEKNIGLVLVASFLVAAAIATIASGCSLNYTYRVEQGSQPKHGLELEVPLYEITSDEVGSGLFN